MFKFGDFVQPRVKSRAGEPLICRERREGEVSFCQRPKKNFSGHHHLSSFGTNCLRQGFKKAHIFSSKSDYWTNSGFWHGFQKPVFNLNFCSWIPPISAESEYAKQPELNLLYTCWLAWRAALWNSFTFQLSKIPGKYSKVLFLRTLPSSHKPKCN